MNYKLSVLVPSIRPQNLKKLYDSIVTSCSYPFEMIVVGPYNLPEELSGYENIVSIQSFRSPLAAQQQALCIAKGEMVTYAADDGYFLPGVLDKSFELLSGKNYKSLITGKYQEGSRVNDNMEKDEYYILNNHVQSSGFFIPPYTYMLNVAVISRKLLLEVGGWDCQFQSCPIGYNDLAIRLKKYSCEIIMQEGIMFECSHLPGIQGDHFAVHISQTCDDEPLFKEMYSKDWVRVAVYLENWKWTSERWKVRFGEEI